MQKKSLKEIECNLCGSNNYTPIGNKYSYQIVSCKCGLIYVNPRPSEEEIDKIYDKEYFSGGYDFGRQKLDYIKDEKVFKVFPKIILGMLNKKFPNKGSILDVGCAAGYLLEIAQDNGWHIDGVEISKFAQEIAEKKLGKKIFSSLNDPELLNKKFDIVASLEVVEHVSDPASLLEDMRQFLKDNGILVVTTPNVKNANLYKSFLDWECILPPVHLYYFSKETISKMLEKAGYDVIDVSYGPTNVFKGTQSKQISNLRNMYLKVKPAFEPIKNFVIDKPVSWYGKKKGLGESLIIFARKRS